MKVCAVLRVLTLLACVSLATGASANKLTGVVLDPSGKPAANVFVIAQDSGRKMAHSVLTDSAGRYRLVDLFSGKYEVRARKSGFNDSALATLELDDRDGTADLKLKPDDAAHITTPGAAWLNPLPNGPMKAIFATSCTVCHDTPMAHAPRDAAGWEETILRMRSSVDSYGVMVSSMDAKKMASWLAENKYGSKIAPFDSFAKKANVVTKASITEYQVGDVTSWMHDIAVEPKTGIVWVGDYGKPNELIRIDPRTGEQKVYPVPLPGAGIHTLNFDRDGALWITLQLAHKVVRFDTKTGKWQIYGGFTPDARNHSFPLDSSGYVKKDAAGGIYISQWGASNEIARLDPQTGEVKEIQLPGPKTDKPYGIAIDSKGVVWFAKYSDNKIGYYDPATGKMKEWELARPHSGPHRMQIDNDDNLWIPLSGYGTVLRYNTVNGSQKEFPLPDADTFPYALQYNAKSDRVWITGNGGNAIYALDPKTGKTTTFRMPSLTSYGRMVNIDYTTGDVWTVTSSYPNELSARDHSLVVRIHHALDFVQ